MRKKVVGIVAIVAMLAAISAMAVPASAYTVSGNRNTQVVKLYFDGRYEASLLAAYPGYAADVVIHEANLKRIPIYRTRDSIKTEIKYYALIRIAPDAYVYRNGQWRWLHEIANPMDIEMYGAEMWVYLLD